MVREERKEMIRREFISKIKFKKKSAPQMKKSREIEVWDAVFSLQAWLIHVRATVKPSLQIKIQVLNYKREGEIN